MLFVVIVSVFGLLSNVYSYQTDPGKYICIDSNGENSTTVASCLPGHVIDIENVIVESTSDDTCWGTARCQFEQKQLLFGACHRKRTCQIDIHQLRTYINATCGSTKRFFTKYRCLPVIQEQKDYLCESPSSRRVTLGDINLSCPRNSRIYINTALIGLSLKDQDESNKVRFKCNKETVAICQSHVSEIYRTICNKQLRPGYEDQCKIKFTDRPTLIDCPHGSVSNYSTVEYYCVPSEGIVEDLPRIDLCSKESPERVRIDRGLMIGMKEDLDVNEETICRKEIFVPRQSRVRLFMLANALIYGQSLQIRLNNQLRSLTANELIDVNVTKEEAMLIELRSNGRSSASFSIYFQIDQPELDEAARSVRFENIFARFRRRDWVILIGSVLSCLLVVLLIVLIFVFIQKSKRLRQRSLRYLRPEDDDDHRQNLQSSPPVLLPPTAPPSDRDFLIKKDSNHRELDNLYEEIKEQQQQAALALSKSKGELFNPYLEAESFQQEKLLLKDHASIPAIRDHHENDKHYQEPKSSTTNDNNA